MYVKYNSTLHGPLAPGAKPPLSVNFLRRYLTIVKRRGRHAFQSTLCCQCRLSHGRIVEQKGRAELACLQWVNLD